MTKTRPVEAHELTIGQSVKFGKDDFRTIVAIVAKWNTLYITVDRGAYREFNVNSRKWRVAA